MAITIPFRGARKYLYGADLVDDAVGAAGAAGRHPAVEFSYYDQIQANRLERVVSETPLAAREWGAVVAVTADGQTRYVGYRAAAEDGARCEAVCEESAHRPGLTVDGSAGHMDRPEGLTSSPIASSVITTKLTSLQRFSFEDVKWLFAKASLKDLPDSWSRIDVATEAGDDARFFKWDVSIDGSPRGYIVFYRGKA